MRKFIAHGRAVQRIVSEFGWYPGARYTNLRDIRETPFSGTGFLDIDWKNYRFDKHISAAAKSKPLLTVARDIECSSQLEQVITEAEQLKQHCDHVVLVPKCPDLVPFHKTIPEDFVLGLSVPSSYGSTRIPAREFDRPTHLLGGRPDVQRNLANYAPVVSVDCNRFTLDARYGKYFNGERFLKHAVGGYERCIRDSISSIDGIWADYQPPSMEW